MGRFNLVDEPWISVIYENGDYKKVSIKKIFEDSSAIVELSGDNKTQDFAVLRFLLSILHTVYSRVNSEGVNYEQIQFIDNFTEAVTIEDSSVESYFDDLHETWDELWRNRSFGNTISKYLDTWHDRFYLLDEKYPFFQVTEREIEPSKLSKSKPSKVMGKSFNRRISESENKIALFSPKTNGDDNNKNKLSLDEIARWLIAYQGYTGLADKVIFGSEKYKVSKGWLFDLGGIYIEGKTLFETFLLNLVMVHSNSEYSKTIQQPCWEHTPKEIIDNYMNYQPINNIAQLYTAWSRAININPYMNVEEEFYCNIVKLPEVNHKDNFIEPMTIWQFNEQGDNKNAYTPRKHRFNQSIWRSFGLVASIYDESKKIKQPEVIRWLREKRDIIGDMCVHIVSISMMDNGDALSWLPINEISDEIFINDHVLTDVAENHWVPRIEGIVEITQNTINKIYWSFLSDLAEIKNIKDKTRQGFINRELEAMYFEIDEPFRIWISSIEPKESKDKKASEWKNTLKKLVSDRARLIFKNSSDRELHGIEKDKKIFNIATAYDKFMINLGKLLN